MPRQRPNLKARLDALRRAEPAAAGALTLMLDAETHRRLKQLAQGEGLRLEVYAAAVLSDHVEATLGDGDDEAG
jgi:hypothetical protein